MAHITSTYFALVPPFVLGLLFVLLWGSWWFHQRSVYLLWMGGCCLLASLPYALQVLIPMHALAEWAPLLSLLYFFATFSWVMAVTKRLRIAPPLKSSSFIFVALMATNILFSRFDDSLPIRVVALCVFLAALVLQTIPTIMRIPHKDGLERTITGVHIFFGIFLLLRTPFFLVNSSQLPSDLIMGETVFWWITVTGSMVFCLMLSSLLLASGVQNTIRTLHEESITDPLTRILNRRGFYQAARQAIRRGAEGRWHTLVVCDLDHFKQVNDQWGHDQGDRVIQAFVAQLRAGTRNSDIISRFGGEEFVMLLLDVKPENALPLLERMRQLFSAQRFETASGNFQASASFGVIQLNPGDQLDHALQRADAQLYRAKELGRNRISLEGLEMLQLPVSSPVQSRLSPDA